MRTPIPGLLPLRRGAVAALLLTSLAASATAADAPKPTAAAKAATSPRAPDDAERAAMLDVLKAETATERSAWLVYGAGDAESKALAEALAGVFREAGWKVSSEQVTGVVLKPGVSMLMADEEPPSWAESALRGMQASGIDVKSATGYRPYYEQKKGENPAWPGIPLKSEQVFVIVLGPEAKA